MITELQDTYKMQVGEYDNNGNIKQFCRFGKVSGSSLSRSRIVGGYYGIMDDLIYTYDGNQLKSVSDVAENDPVYKDVMQFVDGQIWMWSIRMMRMEI